MGAYYVQVVAPGGDPDDPEETIVRGCEDAADVLEKIATIFTGVAPEGSGEGLNIRIMEGAD